MLDQGLNPNGVDGNINATDSVVSAFNKVIGWIKKLQLANNINFGTGFNPDGVEGDVVSTDSVQDSVEKLIWKTKHVIKIDEENWHTETNFYWIIRHDVLFIRFKNQSYYFNFLDTDNFPDYKLIKLNDFYFSDSAGGFSQYVDLIFNKIPWLEDNYITNSGNKYRRLKFIYVYTPYLLRSQVRTKGSGTISFDAWPLRNYFDMYLYYEEYYEQIGVNENVLSSSYGLGVRCTAGSSDITTPMIFETSESEATSNPTFYRVPISYLSTSATFSIETTPNNIIPIPLPV